MNREELDLCPSMAAWTGLIVCAAVLSPLSPWAMSFHHLMPILALLRPFNVPSNIPNEGRECTETSQKRISECCSWDFTIQRMATINFVVALWQPKLWLCWEGRKGRFPSRCLCLPCPLVLLFSLHVSFSRISVLAPKIKFRALAGKVKSLTVIQKANSTFLLKILLGSGTVISVLLTSSSWPHHWSLVHGDNPVFLSWSVWN